MTRLPVNISIYLLALLVSTGTPALLARLGALDFGGDIPTSFVVAATTTLVVLAPVMLVQLVLVSRRNASRPDITSWPVLVLVFLTVLLAIGGLGPGIVFVTGVPALAAWLFWVADEPFPRRRFIWLTATAAAVTVVAMLGGGE